MSLLSAFASAAY
jgi:hypothetical protein